MSDNAISVYLADDHAMVREGLAALVADDAGIQVIGQCGDGLKVVAEVTALCPDVTIVDIAMPGLNGLDICRELSRHVESTAVLILTMYDDDEHIARALRNGACGFLMKEAASECFPDAIRKVARGELYLGPGVSPEALSCLAQGDGDPYESLTTRERQVLQMIAEGRTNRLISEALGIAIKTVDTHRTRLMRKLDIHSQTGLVKFAIRKGIVYLDDYVPQEPQSQPNANGDA